MKQLQQQQAKQKGKAMTWTSQHPTKPGYYWIRNCRVLDAEPNIVEVMPRLSVYATGADMEIDKSDLLSAEWFGPIEPPE